MGVDGLSRYYSFLLVYDTHACLQLALEVFKLSGRDNAFAPLIMKQLTAIGG